MTKLSDAELRWGGGQAQAGLYLVGNQRGFVCGQEPAGGGSEKKRIPLRASALSDAGEGAGLPGIRMGIPAGWILKDSDRAGHEAGPVSYNQAFTGPEEGYAEVGDEVD